MILFDLKCQVSHIFEVWFESSKSYEDQLSKKLISCPFCGSKKITKSLMSPNIQNKSSSSNKIKSKQRNEYNLYKKYLKKINKEITENYEYVGKNFPKEARKIFYGETKDKPIYGEATEKESKDMIDEGLPLVKIPLISNKKKNN